MKGLLPPCDAVTDLMQLALATSASSKVDDQICHRPDAMNRALTASNSRRRSAEGCSSPDDASKPLIALLPFDIDVDPSVVPPERRAWTSKSVLRVDDRADPVDVGKLLRDCVRVQATDLRDAGRTVMQARESRESADGVAISVLVDIEVLIGRTAADARTLLKQHENEQRVIGDPSPLRYVGTAAGLRGLIADIHTMGIADGVMLLPLSGSRMIYEIIDDVFTSLDMIAVD